MIYQPLAVVRLLPSCRDRCLHLPCHISFECRRCNCVLPLWGLSLLPSGITRRNGPAEPDGRQSRASHHAWPCQYTSSSLVNGAFILAVRSLVWRPCRLGLVSIKLRIMMALFLASFANERTDTRYIDVIAAITVCKWSDLNPGKLRHYLSVQVVLQDVNERANPPQNNNPIDLIYQ